MKRGISSSLPPPSQIHGKTQSKIAKQFKVFKLHANISSQIIWGKSMKNIKSRCRTIHLIQDF